MELYYSLLLPLQEELGDSFIIIKNEMKQLINVVFVELYTSDFYERQTSNIISTNFERTVKTFFTKLGLLTSVKKVFKTVDTFPFWGLYSTEGLVLCCIPLPDQRVSRNIPFAVFCIIAACVNNRRLFFSYAEELLFYLPHIKAQNCRHCTGLHNNNNNSSNYYYNNYSNFNNNNGDEDGNNDNNIYLKYRSKRNCKSCCFFQYLLQKGASATGFCLKMSTIPQTLSCTDNRVNEENSFLSNNKEEEEGKEEVFFPEGRSFLLSKDVKDDVIGALLGDAIDINSTLFSCSLVAEFGDELTSIVKRTNTTCSAGEDKQIREAICDALFHAVFRTPFGSADSIDTINTATAALDVLRTHPFEVWCAARRSLRATAELYVLDVVLAKGDRMIRHACVVDEVVAQAVLIHHGGSLVEFVDALFDQFRLLYLPLAPALRRGVDRRMRKVQKRQRQNFQQEKKSDGDTWTVNEKKFIYSSSSLVYAAESNCLQGKGLNGENGFNQSNCLEKDEREGGVEKENGDNEDNEGKSDDDDDEEEEEEDINDVLCELPYVRDFILQHRLTLYNAVLTTVGSNKLEEVFGVPATVFPFLPCARESVAFVTQAYDCIVSQYGPLTFCNFAHYVCDVFAQDAPEIVRHTPRIFRMLNKTRSGVISFEELCSWMARKLSSGSLLRPDAHLLATAMCLRLPLALLLDRRQQWLRMECALESLDETDTDCY